MGRIIILVFVFLGIKAFAQDNNTPQTKLVSSISVEKFPNPLIILDRKIIPFEKVKMIRTKFINKVRIVKELADLEIYGEEAKGGMIILGIENTPKAQKWKKKFLEKNQ